MLYSILFATLAYLSHAQLIDIDLTDYDCTSSDFAKCTGLQNTYGSFLSFPQVGLAGESFVCGESMGYCTLTCNTVTTCDNLGDYGISTATCTDTKCIVDLTCTTSSDCLNAAFPLCVNPTKATDAGECGAQTPAPVDPTRTVTKSPTVTPDPDATKQPTGAPQNADGRKTACIAACVAAGTADDYQRCEADNYFNLITIACEDHDNKCEALCAINYYFEEETAGLTGNTLQLVNDNLPDDPVATFCTSGRCSDTPAPAVTSEDTKAPTTAEQKACTDLCADIDDPMYCEGAENIYGFDIVIPCTEVANECEADCLVEAKKTQFIEDNGATALTDTINTEIERLYPSADGGLVGAFCFDGTCPTPSPEPAVDPCIADPCLDECDGNYWTNDNDCPMDDPDDGCGVQFNVTLDFCLLNRKFNLRQVRRYIRYAYKYALNEISSYSGYCDAEGSLKILRYKPGTKNSNAAKKGRKMPTQKRDDDNKDECDAYSIDDWEDDNCCEDIDDICGSDRSNMQFTIEVDTGFYCGISPNNCDTMRSIAVEVVEKIKEYDAAFIFECLGLSVEDDTVCTTGFGGVTMEVTEAVLAYVDEDGETEIIASTQAGVNGIKYGLALTVAFIMASIY